MAESSSPVRHVTHWIGGKPWSGQVQRHGDVYDPATGQVTGQVDFATAEEAGAAVRAATEAFTSWREVSLSRRAQVLFAFRELVRRHTGELAGLITAERGKVGSDAAGEVARGLEVVEFACGIPHLLKGGFPENVSTGVDSYSLRQPVGVVTGITPFNVVHGDKVAADALLAHPGVTAVSFVGSTPIARYVYETGMAPGKRVQALGGAKNHMVVLPDTDLDLAADAATSAGSGSAERAGSRDP